MKIAIYVPSWPPGKAASGIVTYASQIVPALRELGHEVFIITPTKGDDDPRTIDLNAFSLSPSIWTRAIEQLVPGTLVWRAVALAIRSAVCHLVRTCGVEVFEIEETLGLNFPTSRLRLLPVVVRLHGPWFLTGAAQRPSRNFRPGLRREKCEGIGIKKATLISAPTNEILRAVRAHYRLPLSNACVIPNPLKSADSQSKWRFDSCTPNNLLFIGRFDSQKGGDLVLRVFGELASLYPELRLTFVGPDRGVNGPDNRLHFFESFVQSTLPEWCRSRIDFFGQVPHSELMGLRKKSFITLVASQYETMPYAVLEAMSIGCPIVATHVGGIPEMIQDGRTGLLVPPQDISKMVKACNTLISNPSFAAALGHQSWTVCRELHDSMTVAQQTAQAYQQASNIFKSRL
jgi:glycosyltransferase involved in cell wall biosynthesis